jgi:hypothetical protein
MDPLDNRRLYKRLAVAQDRLVHALVALHESQADALLGGPYDPSAHDALIDRYRQAKREADAARLMCEVPHRHPVDRASLQAHLRRATDAETTRASLVA